MSLQMLIYFEPQHLSTLLFLQQQRLLILLQFDREIEQGYLKERLKKKVSIALSKNKKATLLPLYINAVKSADPNERTAAVAKT